MTCIKCKAQMSQPQLLNMTGSFKKETLTVEIEGRVCAECGHQVVAGKRMAEFMQKLADKYRVMRGLLTSAEILRQREKLGMSQSEFALYLGVGIASVKRWELGEIQTKMVDELIRCKTDPEYTEVLLSDLYRRLVSHSQATASEGAERQRARGGAGNCELLAA